MKDWKMIDYRKVGLKCGIEVHQELEGKKLFCNCPSEIRDDEPHSSVKRRLRAVAGEAGDVDIAALQEMAKGKYFVYEKYLDSTCLVELDETPPNLMNKDALHVALQVSKLLNAKQVDGIQVMRKTVVDGSNTTGFQRSCLVAINGSMKIKDGRIGIDTICIEEDSARIIKKEDYYDVYRLDRLGIPLIEIATSADIRNPVQCREVAEKLGMILRSTGKVKRGLGTIRQDVNVSIKDGNRIEIKGAQELKVLPKLVGYEALRQTGLLEVKKELENRKIKQIKPKIIDVTSVFKMSGSKLIRNSTSKGNAVFGIKLEGFKGLIGKELQPGRRLGTEFADLAKVMVGLQGILHSDELPNYGITEVEINNLKKEFLCQENDAFLLVAGNREDCEKALNAIIGRAKLCLIGVPKEVRKANEDGTTSYLRPMPGAARMYPETDIPIIKITEEMLSKIKIPKLLSERYKEYEGIGLSKDLAELLVNSGKTRLFDYLTSKFKKIKPSYIAELILTAGKSIKKEYGVDIEPTEEDFKAVIRALSNERIAKERILEILKQKRPVKEVIQNYRLVSDKELEQELKKLVDENRELQFNALIGKAMEKLRGKAPGKKIAEMLKKLTS